MKNSRIMSWVCVLCVAAFDREYFNQIHTYPLQMSCLLESSFNLFFTKIFRTDTTTEYHMNILWYSFFFWSRVIFFGRIHLHIRKHFESQLFWLKKSLASMLKLNCAFKNKTLSLKINCFKPGEEFTETAVLSILYA